MVFYLYFNKASKLNFLKTIWKKTYLGKLLSSDPFMGKILSTVLIFYLIIHVFRLEIFPMYMFAMFSKQEVPKEYYHAYKLYSNDQEIDIKDLDYRKYTVLMNTINQYDDIINNNLLHPETSAIDKFIHRLHLENTTIKNKLKRSFHFSKEDLRAKTGAWVSHLLHVNIDDLRIEKEFYNWDKSTPQFYNKTIIYGVD